MWYACAKMSKEEATTDKRWDEQYQNWFAAVKTLDIDKLLRADAPEYNFNEVKAQVGTALDTIIELEQNYDFWVALPQRHRDSITTKVSQILGILDEVQNFNPEQDNAWTQRNNLVTRFNNEYREFYEQLIERLQAYLGQRAYSQELAGEFGKQAKLELDEIRKTKGEIDKVKQAVDEAATIASDTASTATAQFFDEEAEQHNGIAGKWLIAVIVLSGVVAIVTFIFSLSVITNWNEPEKVIANTTLLTLKLVVIGVSVLALRFTTKNYNANKHLAVVNKHRANVLKSIEAHRTTAVSDATKDTVLAAGVATAFSHVETGYITIKEGAGNNGDDSTAILKVISSDKRAQE